MVRRKLDNRIKILIDNGIALGHRTVFAVVGEKGRDQVSTFLKQILLSYVTIPILVIIDFL